MFSSTLKNIKSFIYVVDTVMKFVFLSKSRIKNRKDFSFTFNFVFTCFLFLGFFLYFFFVKENLIYIGKMNLKLWRKVTIPNWIRMTETAQKNVCIWLASTDWKCLTKCTIDVEIKLDACNLEWIVDNSSATRRGQKGKCPKFLQRLHSLKTIGQRSWHLCSLKCLKGTLNGWMVPEYRERSQLAAVTVYSPGAKLSGLSSFRFWHNDEVAFWSDLNK